MLTMLKNKKVILNVMAVLAVILTAVWVERSRAGSGESNMPTSQVNRGPLTISVVESGTIRSLEQIIIKNEVEGQTSIIYLIPEGTQVKKGDLLVELDASSLEDSKLDQDILVQNAEAADINATENLAVVENQAKSDIDLAQLTMTFAKQDLEKYLKGEYPNELQKAEADITLAKEELARASETLKWSQRLNEEKYLSDTERQADELNWRKKTLDLELAKNNLHLLTNYTYQRRQAQLTSDVKQAEMALERTTRKGNANLVQAKADSRAKTAEFNRQKDRLQKIIDQISKTKIYAPTNGLVIYATSAQSGGFRHNVTPLEEGQDVHERQELIYLPTANSRKAEITIHESNLKKVHSGMPAMLTVDAIPGMKFFGKVAQIAPLPDARSMWMNPDLKVYPTEIHLDTLDDSLRSGMSCKVEIIVAQHQDAIYVPVQAVLRVNGNPTVFIKEGNKFVPRTIRTGLDNNIMIHVLEGIAEGETVLMTPPLHAGSDICRNVTLPENLLTDGTPEKSAVKNPAMAPNSGMEKVIPAAQKTPVRRKSPQSANGEGSGAGKPHK
jgi:HlyD family secretion protein